MFSLRTVKAHCDIPCKIYDPAISQVAALSVVRLLDLIEETGQDEYSVQSEAMLSRLVLEKEEQARIVKNEINIIWGDYFKAPQIEISPTVHELVHSIMQAASRCKQDVGKDNGVVLLRLVNDFTSIFWETKGIATRTVIAPYPPALDVIQPILEDA